MQFSATNRFLSHSLGIPNCKEILEVLGKLSRKKMLRKFIVIGDFNLNGVTWATDARHLSKKSS